MHVKYFSQNSAAGAVHGVDGKLEIRAADEIEIGELGNRFDVGRLQIHLFDCRCGDFRGWLPQSSSVRRSGRAVAGHGAVAEFVFDRLHDRGRSRASELGFKLHAIPVSRIVARSNHDDARCAQLVEEAVRRWLGL